MHTLTANNPEREDLVAAPRSGLLLPALAILAVLFLVRLPTFIHARELNMDESQMLSQAMKFLLDAVPWRSVDGTSSGPLNSFFLSGFLWLGIPPGYVFLHVLATAMASLLVVTAFLSIRTLATRRAAAWGVAPMTLCVGFSGNPAFLHYSSELLPALLLALACYFLLRWFVGAQKYPEKSRSICLFFIGASLGSAPWCKLQSAPLSLTLAVAATIAIFVYRKNSLRWAELLFLCIGLALPSILMVMVVLRAGVWNDFWTSYVLANLAYAGPFTWARFSRHILLTLRSIEILPLTSVCAFALLLAGYFAYRKPRRVRPGQHQAVIVFFALFSAVSLASVARPAYFFPHYILFLLFPLSCLAAILISWEFPHLGENLRSLLSTAAKLALAAIVFLFSLPLVLTALDTAPLQPDPNEQIAAAVLSLKASTHASGMAIWGWMPGVYVDTGIPPATRDAIGHFVISKSPLQGYFRARFLKDLRNSSPDLFVDAVAPGAFLWKWDPQQDGFESDANLKEYVEQNYVLADTVPLRAKGIPVRIFLRRTLAERISPRGPR